MHRLEDRLEALHGPMMPADVEARVRHRVFERPEPASNKGRLTLRASYAQLIVLLVLLVAAGYVFKSSVGPVLRSAWERAHCLVDPGAKKP